MNAKQGFPVIAKAEPSDVIEARIKDIFSDDAEIPSVSLQSIQHYGEYLQAALTHAVKLKGDEPFPWEEYYVFGSGDKAEHDALRKEQPSYLDSFQLKSVCEEVDELTGVQIVVNRLSDDAEFTLPLIDVAVDTEFAKSQQIIEDYQYWWTDYLDFES